MKIFTFILVALAASALSSCVTTTGQNFQKPAADTFTLGKTTPDDVLSALGAPKEKFTEWRNGFEIVTFYYAYTYHNADTYPNMSKFKSLRLGFNKNRLVGKLFQSVFDDDSTVFDRIKAQKIKKGMNRGEVIDLLGNPVGEYIFPSFGDKRFHKIVYSCAEIINNRLSEFQLVVTLDQGEVVNSVQYSEN